MTNFTAFNYNKRLKERDFSKLYETQTFESSIVDQEFVSLADLVNNGVNGVLRSSSGKKDGKKKVMRYDDILEPVERFDLSDYNPSELKELRDHFIQQKKELKENDRTNQSNITDSSVLDKAESGQKEVSPTTK